MKIVAYETKLLPNKVAIYESTGDKVASKRLDELFSFLLEQYDNCIKVCWNLNETIAPLLKILGEKRCQNLHTAKKLHYPPFGIFYIPDKVFSVKHIPSRASLNLYGIDQYYPDIIDNPNVDNVQGLGENLMHNLDRMGLQPTKLTSPIAIYQQCILSKLDLPKLSDMPVEVIEYANRCAGKLWIEAHQVGYWEQVFNYDIVASFPAVMQELLDIRYCDWVQSDKYVDKAIYGYCKGKITIYDDVQVSPIIRIKDDGSSSSPTGTWLDYLTKNEIDFIQRWKIGKFNIENGYWAIPKVPIDEITRPLKEPLSKILKFREMSGIQSFLAKRMSVGIYGKTGEEYEEVLGPYANPCWFAETSTQVRLQVAEFICSNQLQQHLIHVGVDGILLDKKTSIK